MTDDYYDLKICRISVGRNPEKFDGKVLCDVSINTAAVLNNEALDKHLTEVGGAPYFLTVGDNGEYGDGVWLRLHTNKTEELGDGYSGVVDMGLTLVQTRLLHAALGCILRMRAAQKSET